LQPRSLLDRPAGIAQQRYLLRDKTGGCYTEQEKSHVQHPECRLACRLPERKPERTACSSQFACSAVAAGRLAQTVRNNRPTDKQHEKCQAKHGVAPAI